LRPPRFRKDLLSDPAIADDPHRSPRRPGRLPAGHASHRRRDQPPGRDTTDFIVAGKRLGIALCTGTLAATWFGGGPCIGAASAAYGGGLLAVIADPFGAALCLFLAGLFYVRLMRRMGLMTVACGR